MNYLNYLLNRKFIINYFFILFLIIYTCSGSASTVLWGDGAKSCTVLLTSAPNSDLPLQIADPVYLRLREWLAGFLTGLNLSTGSDVLHGVELDAAFLRIQAFCHEHPEDDWFNASLRLLRSVGSITPQPHQSKK